ncbi:hypothetical protein D918_03904 [Trichuris suis]|nr:hypothetical protein D918_03904 [Trichuris suis]
MSKVVARTPSEAEQLTAAGVLQVETVHYPNTHHSGPGQPRLNHGQLYRNASTSDYVCFVSHDGIAYGPGANRRRRKRFLRQQKRGTTFPLKILSRKKKGVNKKSSALIAHGQWRFSAPAAARRGHRRECVYVDSQRPDQPYYVASIQAFKMIHQRPLAHVSLNPLILPSCWRAGRGGSPEGTRTTYCTVIAAGEQPREYLSRRRPGANGDLLPFCGAPNGPPSFSNRRRRSSDRSVPSGLPPPLSSYGLTSLNKVRLPPPFPTSLPKVASLS